MGLTDAEVNRLAKLPTSPIRYIIEVTKLMDGNTRFIVLTNEERAKKQAEGFARNINEYKNVKLHRAVIDNTWEPAHSIVWNEIEQEYRPGSGVSSAS